MTWERDRRSFTYTVLVKLELKTLITLMVLYCMLLNFAELFFILDSHHWFLHSPSEDTLSPITRFSVTWSAAVKGSSVGAPHRLWHSAFCTPPCTVHCAPHCVSHHLLCTVHPPLHSPSTVSRVFGRCAPWWRARKGLGKPTYFLLQETQVFLKCRNT